MSRAIAVVSGVFALASLLGASPIDISVSPNAPKGCVASILQPPNQIDYPPIDCPSSPFFISPVLSLRTALTINFTASPSAQMLTTLDALSVNLWVADNPGLLGRQFDAASEAGSVYLVVAGTQFLLGNFGGGTDGLKANPIGSPLALTLNVAQVDLPAVLEALRSAGFVFGLKVFRTDGDFDVINAAGATAELEGIHNPEPATVSFIGIGLAGLWALRRRRALRPKL
jgi:hypothetical protein